MGDRKTLVNFRLVPDLVEQIDAAAARAGLNRTEWVTTTLTMAARTELEGRTRAVAARVPAAQLPVADGRLDGCAHPKGQRAWVADGQLVCLDCGTTLQRIHKGA